MHYSIKDVPEEERMRKEVELLTATVAATEVRGDSVYPSVVGKINWKTPDRVTNKDSTIQFKKC